MVFDSSLLILIMFLKCFDKLFFFYRYKPEYVQKEFYSGGHIEVSRILNLLLAKCIKMIMYLL